MVTASVVGARQREASAEAVLRKIKAAIARMRRASHVASLNELDALMRDCDALAERIEDAVTERAYLLTRDQPTVPDAVLGRLLAGERPMRVWREYRGLTLRALAAQTGIGASTLSEIETGVTDGSLRTLRRIATALDVAIDDLIPPGED
jgi:DNA-binding XRE family transcriptional regulator